MRVRWRMMAVLASVGLLAGSLLGSTDGVGATADPGADAEPEPAPTTIEPSESPAVSLEPDMTLRTSTAIGAPSNLAPNVLGDCGQFGITFNPFNGCTFFAANALSPIPGNSTVLSASVRSGPNPAPMRFVVFRVIRSAEQPPFGEQIPDSLPIFLMAQSQVFTPNANGATTVNVNLPMRNAIEIWDGEQVEVVDRLGIAVLGPSGSLPLFGPTQLPITRAYQAAFPDSPPGTFVTGGISIPVVPTITGQVCSGGSLQQATRSDFVMPDEPLHSLPLQQIQCPGTPGSPGPSPSPSPSPGTPGGSGSSEFVGITPARLLDTRPGGETVDGQFQLGAELTGGQEIALDVAGRGDIPDDADAVVLNVTVTDPENFGFITAYPCGIDRPNASNINFAPGQTIPNSVVVKVGDGGKVCLFSDQTTHLLADGGGYLPAGASYLPLDPSRLLDTRPGGETVDGQFELGAELTGGQEIALDVAGRGGVPDDADAVVLNVTVTDPENFGFITAAPCGTERPNASNLNFEPGRTIANTVVVKVGSGGRVCLFSDQSTHLLADVGGAFPSSSGFTSLEPARFLDTRPGASTFDGAFAGAGKLDGGSEIALDVAGRGEVPDDATAVVLNVTVNDPDNFGFATIYPCGVDRPNASNLNFVPGQTIPNAVIVGVGSGGRVCLFSDQTTNLIADVSGYVD